MTKRLTEIKREQGEYEVQRRSMGLQVSGLLPVMALKVPPRPTRRIKAKVAERYSTEKSRLYNEAGYISEYALHRYLLGIKMKHHWKLASQVPPDFKIWRNEKLVTVGIRSRSI